MTDDDLILGMLSADPALAAVARRVFDARHAGEVEPAAPAHCDQCFEGCEKCQPNSFNR